MKLAIEAQNYLNEKERLSQILNGQDRLNAIVESLSSTLNYYHLLGSPGLALDVVKFTLETHHLHRLNLTGRQ